MTARMKNRDRNKPRRQQRQAEAKVRTEAYSLLTPKQRLAKLAQGCRSTSFLPLNAKKQCARIVAAKATVAGTETIAPVAATQKGTTRVERRKARKAGTSNPSLADRMGPALSKVLGTDKKVA